MGATTIEPGLLRVFRWFVAVRLSLLVLTAWSIRNRPDPANPRFPGVGIVLYGLLLLLLAWPWLERSMGRAFLPAALTLASIAPIAESAANVRGRLDAGLGVNAALADYWMTFFLLFVPLLLIAWQYRYRGVLLFSAATASLDLASLAGLLEGNDVQLGVLVAIVLARALLYAFVGLFIVKLVKAQKQARRALSSHGATLEQLATSRERNRLARELHDTLAHSLAAVAVQLEAVRSRWDEDPAEARRILDRSLQGARDGLAEARRAIAELRASPLEDFGLNAALRRLGAATEARSGIPVVVALDSASPDLDPGTEQAVYRIADEALTNSVRHSGAGQVELTLRRERGRLRLLVADDGAGFDGAATIPDGHVGLAGMTERAQLVGGTLDISSVPGSGTTVRFEVPEWA